MNEIILRPLVRLDIAIDELEQACENRVGWADTQRINADGRLILLGFQQMLDDGSLDVVQLKTAATVLGCVSSSMESYEAVDDGVRRGIPAPLAYSHALPSIPAACAALRWQLSGLMYTLVGRAEVGLKVVQIGRRFIRAGRADRVVVGSWSVNVQKGDSDRHYGRARIRLAALERKSPKPDAFYPLKDY